MSTFITILGIILFVVGIVLVFVTINGKSARGLGVVALMVGLVITLVAQSLVIIPTNYTGVKTTFGQINEKPLNSGPNFKIPFIQSVEKVNNKQQDMTAGQNEIWSETVNRTPLYYKNITVTFQINHEKSAWIYANISNYEQNLISEEIVASAVKSSSKTLKDEDATNRSIIEPLVATNLQKSIDEKYGKDVVVIKKVVIEGVDFEESYNQAIAQKQNAQIAYEQQQIDNQRLIEKEQAEAEAKIIKAEGEAKANEVLKASISEEVLKSKMLDKWNGELPKAVGDSSSFILDIFSDGQ